MQSNDLKVDESSLTGESDQVEMFFLKNKKKMQLILYRVCLLQHKWTCLGEGHMIMIWI